MQAENSIHDDYAGNYLYEGYSDLFDTDEDCGEDISDLLEDESTDDFYYDELGYIRYYEDEEDYEEEEE